MHTHVGAGHIEAKNHTGTQGEGIFYGPVSISLGDGALRQIQNAEITSIHAKVIVEGDLNARVLIVHAKDSQQIPSLFELIGETAPLCALSIVRQSVQKEPTPAGVVVYDSATEAKNRCCQWSGIHDVKWSGALKIRRTEQGSEGDVFLVVLFSKEFNEGRSPTVAFQTTYTSTPQWSPVMVGKRATAPLNYFEGRKLGGRFRPQATREKGQKSKEKKKKEKKHKDKKKKKNSKKEKKKEGKKKRSHESAPGMEDLMRLLRSSRPQTPAA
jgi:hypothetical protein